MNYLRFRNDIFFVRSDNSSVVYDIVNKKLYYFNERQTKFINKIINSGLNDWHKSNKYFISLLNKIYKSNLGELYKNKVYVEEAKLNSPLVYEIREFRSINYRMVYISITDKCDWECSYCPIDNTAMTFKECQTCLIKVQPNKKRLDISKLLKQVVQLGPGTICIRGGNPLLEWELLIYILDVLKRDPSISVILTTPGTGVDIKRIIGLVQDYKKLRLNIVVNCESIDFERFKKKRKYENQIEVIKYLKKLKRPFFLTLLSFGFNKERLIDKYRNQFKINPGISFLYKSTNDNKMIESPIINWKYLPLKIWNTKEEFFIRYYFHPCLLGTLDLDLSGAINPCPGFKNISGKLFGIASEGLICALKEYSLYEIAERKNDELCCSKCPIRFICMNCPSYNQQIRFHDKIKPYCPYYSHMNGLNYMLVKQNFKFISSV